MEIPTISSPLKTLSAAAASAAASSGGTSIPSNTSNMCLSSSVTSDVRFKEGSLL